MRGLERLSPLIRSFVEKGPTGCSVMVAQNGQILFEDYAGMADVEENRPVSRDTIFRIFSMTKVVTCAAALQLYEKGLYLLNDPLYEYLPEWKDSLVYEFDPNGDFRARRAKSPIRVKDLFCMSTGLTYGGEDNATARAMACGGSLEGVRILGSQTIDLMRQNHLSPQQMEDFNWPFLAGYGYGLGVRTMVNPQAGGCNGSLGEFGWCGMLGTWVMIDPAERLTAVYMQQLTPNLEAYHQPRMRSVIYGSL